MMRSLQGDGNAPRGDFFGVGDDFLGIFVGGFEAFV
jgi:hypothetical protein